MERNTLWKNFLLLTFGGLMVLHMNRSQSDQVTSKNVRPSSNVIVQK